MQERKLLLLASIMRAHGIRGEVFMRNFTDSPQIFDDLDFLYLSKDGANEKKMTIKYVREHKEHLLIQFDEINTRNDAELLRGLSVYADSADLADDENVYLHELTDFKIYLENGDYLGRISGFLEVPGQETWIIEHESGKEIYFPVVEEFLRDVNVEESKITIAPPEGLLDIYLAEKEETPKLKKPSKKKTPEERKIFKEAKRARLEAEEKAKLAIKE